ncbi:MAG: hypothetical protein IPQ24_15095 [Anaeromyxobacter sp.]|nr:hypothetical protein [Anaeromyxobacter sp.]
MAGPQGPIGPPGIVSATEFTGGIGLIPNDPGCNGLTGMVFITGTVSVAVTASQMVTVTGTAGLATDLAPASNLSLNVCYDSVTTGFVADGNFFGSAGFAPLALPALTGLPFTLSRAFTALPDDTYTIGLCGCIAGPDIWIADWSQLMVQVVQQ